MLVGETSRCTTRALCAAVERVGDLNAEIQQRAEPIVPAAVGRAASSPSSSSIADEALALVLADIVGRADVRVFSAEAARASRSRRCTACGDRRAR